MLRQIYDSECAKSGNYGLYDYLVESTNDEKKIKPYGRVDRSRYAFTYQYRSHNYLVGEECKDKISDKYCYYFSGDTNHDEKIQSLNVIRIARCDDEVELSLYAIETLINMLLECKKYINEYPDWKLEIILSDSLCADNIEMQTYNLDDCLNQVKLKYAQLKAEYEKKRIINEMNAKKVLKGIKSFEEKRNKKH